MRRYIIVMGDLDSDQLTDAALVGITNPRQPLDGSNKTIVAFTNIPSSFNGLISYSKAEILSILTELPWSKPDVFDVGG